MSDQYTSTGSLLHESKDIRLTSPIKSKNETTNEFFAFAEESLSPLAMQTPSFHTSGIDTPSGIRTPNHVEPWSPTLHTLVSDIDTESAVPQLAFSFSAASPLRPRRSRKRSNSSGSGVGAYAASPGPLGLYSSLEIGSPNSAYLEANQQVLKSRIGMHLPPKLQRLDTTSMDSLSEPPSHVVDQYNGDGNDHDNEDDSISQNHNNTKSNDKLISVSPHSGYMDSDYIIKCSNDYSSSNSGHKSSDSGSGSVYVIDNPDQESTQAHRKTKREVKEREKKDIRDQQKRVRDAEKVKQKEELLNAVDRMGRSHHESGNFGTPMALSGGGARIHTVSPPGSKPVTCNCKKSKCLKLYCDCFRIQVYCKGCNCSGCSNTIDNETQRRQSMASILERNPGAFKPRVLHDVQKGKGNGQHMSGCHCKRSACLKKYCECFTAMVACAELCQCSDCKNTKDVAERRMMEAKAKALELNINMKNKNNSKPATMTPVSNTMLHSNIGNNLSPTPISILSDHKFGGLSSFPAFPDVVSGAGLLTEHGNDTVTSRLLSHTDSSSSLLKE